MVDTLIKVRLLDYPENEDCLCPSSTSTEF